MLYISTIAVDFYEEKTSMFYNIQTPNLTFVGRRKKGYIVNRYNID